MAHTPGPWILLDSEFPQFFICNADTHEDICKCNIGEMSLKEIEANANLISAAPDLLEALDGLINFSGDDDRIVILDKSRILAARAAIAKAKGLNPDQG